MNPISTSTLGMSAAFSTTNPACRAGLVQQRHLARRRLPTTPCASRAEPMRVSCRTRLARMRATSGRGVAEVLAAEAVGGVLAPRQRRGLRVRGGVGERIDAGAAHRMVGQRVGVHGDEQRRAALLRDRHPFLQRDEDVARARQLDAIAPAGQQLPPQLLRRGEGDMLLVGAGDADRAGVLAAMPGVEHHQRRRGGASVRRAPLRLGRGGKQETCHGAGAEQQATGDHRTRPFGIVNWTAFLT